MDNEKNSMQIVDAHKAQLQKRINISLMQEKIREIHNKIRGDDFKALTELYLTIFKNINPDKKFACDIDAYKSSHSYYSDSEGTKKKRIFLNKDGFTISYSFDPIDIKPNELENLNNARTNYIHTYGDFSEYILILKRLFKQKNEIINAIERDSKKQVAIKFFQAFELSGCDKVFSYNDDFDNIKIEINPPKTIYFFNGNEISSINAEYIECKNANSSITVGRDKTATWRNNDHNINLDDLEKTSQIYEEIINFLNLYYEQFVKQDNSIIKLTELIKEYFAKELILKSLEDKK